MHGMSSCGFTKNSFTCYIIYILKNRKCSPIYVLLSDSSLVVIALGCDYLHICFEVQCLYIVLYVAVEDGTNLSIIIRHTHRK